MNEEAEFHRQLAENPNDRTTRLVYADWLEEHGGQPGLAAALRGNQEAPHSNWNQLTHNDQHIFLAHSPTAYFTAGKNNAVSVYFDAKHGPKSYFNFLSYHPTERVGEILRGLHNEGVQISPGYNGENNRAALEGHLKEPAQMSRKQLLRRYATKTQALPTQTGIPVHKLVHNAMLDAANEAGLIPHDQPGDQQYHTFAKYRDQAHEELSNPDSPFTKMFYRHKAQLHTTPNPREHLKNALTPLFKYLSHGSKSPTIPTGSIGESEPIDLLGGVHHPFEGDSGSFEYQPRLPSGFVEVPPPQPKRKPSPIRNDVYKSIAEHEDMGWSAPDKLKDYLVNKHGITPQEAATHIGNWRRKSKKPTAPNPIATKRVWPPIQRKSRIDSTDLLAIPKRYMRVGDPHTHDQIMKGIVRNRDEAGLGPFADFLQEQSAPGAALAREAHSNSLNNKEYSPFGSRQWWDTGDHDVPGNYIWYGEDGEQSTHRHVPEGTIEVQPTITHPSKIGGYRTGALTVTHGPQHQESYASENPGEQLLQYHVPVHSRKHLTELIHDLPEPMRNKIWATMAPHLREDHEQEASTTTGTPPDDESVKMDAYRAPKGGVIVRGSQYKGGEMVPSMESKFMNPRRNLSRKYGKNIVLSKIILLTHST